MPAGPAAAAASDLAAVLAAEGWRDSHVLLKQWQCTIALWAAKGASRGSAAAAEAAQQNEPGKEQTLEQPAVVLHYQTAGISEVRTPPAL